MREFNINTKVQVFTMEELPEEYKCLVEAAKQQVNNSYSPYSRFSVGAAVRLANGEIVTGSNQENAAYPSGLCAERTTMYYASARYPQEAMRALAIAAFTDGHYTEDPVSPCGACRQVMVEYEDKFKQPLRVLLYGTNNVYVFESAKSLMPFCFVGESLKGLKADI